MNFFLSFLLFISYFLLQNTVVFLNDGKLAPADQRQATINQLIKDIHFKDEKGMSILPIWRKKNVTYRVRAFGSNSEDLKKYTKRFFEKLEPLTGLEFTNVSSDKADIDLAYISDRKGIRKFDILKSSHKRCKANRKTDGPCFRRVPLGAGRARVIAHKNTLHAVKCRLVHTPKYELINYVMKVNLEKGRSEQDVAHAYAKADTVEPGHSFSNVSGFKLRSNPKDKKTAFSLEHIAIPGVFLDPNHYRKKFPEAFYGFESFWNVLVEQCVLQSIGFRSILPIKSLKETITISGLDPSPEYSFQFHCQLIGIFNLPRVFGCFDKTHSEKMKRFQTKVVKQIYGVD